MGLTAAIRIILIFFVQRSPTAAACANNRMIFNQFGSILIECNSFKYTMLAEIDVFQPDLDVFRQNTA
ncbi:hypothetical protein D3C74_307780 [compost metagenome]